MGEVGEAVVCDQEEVGEAAAEGEGVRLRDADDEAAEARRTLRLANVGTQLPHLRLRVKRAEGGGREGRRGRRSGSSSSRSGGGRMKEPARRVRLEEGGKGGEKGSDEECGLGPIGLVPGRIVRSSRRGREGRRQGVCFPVTGNEGGRGMGEFEEGE